MEGVSRCTMLYNPMSHGAHTSLYNPMTHGAHASLYNPMTHGDLYPLYNGVWPQDPWGFVTSAAPMTHGKKVAEPCEEFLVVDVRNGLKVEVHRGVYHHEGKGSHVVCEEAPVGTGPRAIGGTKYRAQTLEEHHNSG